MSPNLLIVTAKEADYKTFNRLLVKIHDLEYNEDMELDWYYILTGKEVPKLKETSEKDVDGEISTFPGTFNADNSTNAWAGASYEAVEDFWRENWSKEPAMLKNHTSLLVLDDQGLADETIIMANRNGALYRELELKEALEAGEIDEDEMKRRIDEQPMKFDKARVPWTHVHITMMNLDIANMDWEDFCTDEEGDENGWWEYDGSHYEMTKKAIKIQEDMLAKLRTEGKV